MEALVLILLILVIFVFVLPILAITKASNAESDLKDLRRKLEATGANAFTHASTLEARLDALEKRLQNLPDGTVVAPAPAPELGGGSLGDEAGRSGEASAQRATGEFSAVDDQAPSKPIPVLPPASQAAKAEAEAERVEPAVRSESERPAAGPEPERRVATTAPVAKRTAAEPAEPAQPKGEVEPGALEMKLGTYWFVRIGVVLLLTGAGILAYYKKQFFFDLSPATKVGGLYLLSALMGGVGFWLQRAKEAYKNYGQVLLAGGISGVYFTTYAAHIFEPVKVIPDPTVALLLLFGWGGVIVWLADRLRSETLGMFAIGASYYATYVPLVHSAEVPHWVILASNLILALAAVLFMLRNRWLKLPVLSISAAYAGFGIWRLRILEEPSLGLVILFVGSLWVVFTVAVFLSRHPGFHDRARAIFLTANNAALFALPAWDVLRTDEDAFWILPMSIGGVLIVCALALPRLLRDQVVSRNSYLTQGLVLVALGLIATQLSDSLKGPIFAAESVVLLFLGIRSKNVILQVGGFAAAGVALIFGLIDIGQSSEGYLISCLGIAAFLLFDAWLSHRKLESASDDLLRARVSSFVGAALFIGTTALVFNGGEWLPAILALTTLGLVASAYLLRMRELVFLGQVPALLGLLRALESVSLSDAFTWPLFTTWLAVLGLMHWWRWQRDEFAACCADREQGRFLAGVAEVIYSFGAVALLFFWMHSGIGLEEKWLLLGSLLAIGLAVYGLLTRAWFFAASAQLFLGVACLEQVRTCLSTGGGNEFALHALIPIATAWLVSAVLPVLSKKLESFHEACRVVAALMGALWIYRFVADEYQMLLSASLAGLFLIAGVWRPSRTWQWLASAYLVVAGLYLAEELVHDLARWQSLVAIAGVLVAQQVARRHGRFKLPDEAHPSLILGAGAALFFWSTVAVADWMPSVEHHGLRSITWAVLAVLYFTLGLKLRERWHRLMGLATLGIALLSLFPIIWQMSTELKIVSFFVLGLVFVGLGFVYNRNKEQIRKLL